MLKKSINEPRITLVGAGPGAKDLITLRGFQAMQNANIILYDALISEELLAEIDASIPKICVGKRCNKHSYSQDEINLLMVESAFQYGHVVRLKGGDPFVFGRATEEIDFAESFGISVAVIPGISSAIGVPENQGIPLTQRGISSSFWVMTATKKDGSFSDDLKYAAKSSTTMIILMGIHKLEEITLEILKYKSNKTPFAVIQNGTLSNETAFVGILGEVFVISKKIDKTQPGIIVVGEVVSQHPLFFEEEIQRVLHSYI